MARLVRHAVPRDPNRGPPAYSRACCGVLVAWAAERAEEATLEICDANRGVCQSNVLPARSFLLPDSQESRSCATNPLIRLPAYDSCASNLVNKMLALRSPSLFSRLTIRSRRPSNTRPFNCQCYLAVLIEIYSDFFRGCQRRLPLPRPPPPS